MNDILLEARGISRSYRPRGARGRETHALLPTDLSVHAGETLAIVGESGSGKSTLVRMLLALDEPTTGAVYADGSPVPASAAALRAYRRRTGVVFQDPYSSLDPRMRVGRAVAEPLRGFGIGGDHAAAVAEALARVGLPDDAAERYPHEFSGGQRQRIAIARAIVHRPQLLVGDEPLSALDVTVRARILELFAELTRELGLTLVLVSHDLGVVRRINDRVAVLEAGELVELGAAEDVLTAPAHAATRRLVAAVPRLS